MSSSAKTSTAISKVIRPRLIAKSKWYRKHFPSWPHFIKHLEDGYLQWNDLKREPILFRGHSNDTWRLSPSLDRGRSFESPKLRDQEANKILSVYKNAIQRLHDRRLDEVFNAEELEMHARHHGLPTRLLDWTTSPFIAAHFAFFDAIFTSKDLRTKNITIFRYSPAQLKGSNFSDRFEVQPCDGRSNPRAWSQRSVFIRIISNEADLLKLAPDAISEYSIPFSEARTALTWLAEMGVSPEVLFPDHDGAAKLACLRTYDWSTLS